MIRSGPNPSSSLHRPLPPPPQHSLSPHHPHSPVRGSDEEQEKGWPNLFDAHPPGYSRHGELTIVKKSLYGKELLTLVSIASSEAADSGAGSDNRSTGVSTTSASAMFPGPQTAHAHSAPHNNDGNHPRSIRSTRQFAARRGGQDRRRRSLDRIVCRKRVQVRASPNAALWPGRERALAV